MRRTPVPRRLCRIVLAVAAGLAAGLPDVAEARGGGGFRGQRHGLGRRRFRPRWRAGRLPRRRFRPGWRGRLPRRRFRPKRCCCRAARGGGGDRIGAAWGDWCDRLSAAQGDWRAWRRVARGRGVSPTATWSPSAAATRSPTAAWSPSAAATCSPTATWSSWRRAGIAPWASARSGSRPSSARRSRLSSARRRPSSARRSRPFVGAAASLPVRSGVGVAEIWRRDGGVWHLDPMSPRPVAAWRRGQDGRWHPGPAD